MKVSIVSISYNQAKFLEQAIQSVLAQDYPDIEYIVVDAGSTDGSREIIERFRCRIHHLILEPDDGPADGLNKGFRMATGELYGVLNADDMLHPRAVTRFVRAFESLDADVISGHAYLIDKHGHVLGKVFSDRFDAVAYVHNASVLVQPSTFFRAAFFHRVDGFNTQNRESWDGEFWFDLARHGARFARIQGCWSYFRIHPESITGSGLHRKQLVRNRQRLGASLGHEHIDSLLRRAWLLLRSKSLNPVVLIEKYVRRRNIRRLLERQASNSQRPEVPADVSHTPAEKD